MKITNCLVLLTAFGAALGAGCGPAAPKANVAVNQAVVTSNVNAATPPKTEAVNAETPKAETTSPAAGSLSTPTEAYKTAHAARQSKDIEGLKKALSKDILDFFTEIGKTEKKSLDDELRKMISKPQATKAEARSEKISGDRATIEYLDENGDWEVMDFIKEGNDWKLTMPEAAKPGADDKAKTDK